MNKVTILAKVKRRKFTTALVIVLLLAVLIYFFRDKLFAQKAVTNNSFIKTGISSNYQPSRPNSSSSSSENVMLKKGSKGDEVKELQRLLNHKQKTTIPKADSPLFLLHGAMKGSLLVVDGKFGVKTEQALHRWTGLSSITLAQARKVLG